MIPLCRPLANHLAARLGQRMYGHCCRRASDGQSAHARSRRVISRGGVPREPQRPSDQRTGTQIRAHGQRPTSEHAGRRRAGRSDWGVVAHHERPRSHRGQAPSRRVGIRGGGGRDSGGASVRPARGRRSRGAGRRSRGCSRQEAGAIDGAHEAHPLLPDHRTAASFGPICRTTTRLPTPVMCARTICLARGSWSISNVCRTRLFPLAPTRPEACSAGWRARSPPAILSPLQKLARTRLVYWMLLRN